MSQPLIMSFRPDAAEMCLDGRKTMTRRHPPPGPWMFDPNPTAPAVIYRDRVLWRVGDLITIKASRTGPGVGRVRCTGLRWPERVRDITEEDAIREGVSPVWHHSSKVPSYREGFRDVWRSLYPSGPKSWDADPLVLVIEFEPLQPVALPFGGLAEMPTSAEEP